MADRNVNVRINVDNQNANQQIDSTRKGISGLGTALKGLGIVTVIVGLFNTLKDMLMKNEKVVKLVETGMNFLQIVMNKVVDTVVKVVEKVADMSKNMEGTKAVISGLVTLGLTPMKLAFDSIVLAVKSLQLGWTQMFDKKNTDKISSLTTDIEELKTSLGNTATKAADAVVSVVTNTGKMIGEVTNVAKETYSIVSAEVKKFNAQATLDEAARAANAKKNYGLIALAAQEEIDKLEAISEINRQNRDDTNKSYADRKQASNDLIESNKQQYEAALKLAQAHIDEAKANYELNKNADTLLALRTAEGEIIKANADYQGKISEQKAADLGLTKEQIDAEAALNKTVTDAAASETKLQANKIKDINERIKKLKEIEDAEYAANQKVLQDKIKGLEEGSAAWYAAKQEEVTLTAAHNATISGLDDQAAEDTKTRLQEEADLKKQAAEQAYEAIKVTEEAYTQFSKNLLSNKLKKGLIDQKTYDKELEKIEIESAKRKKALAITDTIISTAQSIMSIWNSAMKIDPTGILATTLSVTAGALGAAQVALIASQPIGGGSSAGSSSPSFSAPAAGSTTPTTSFSFAADTKQTTEPVVIKSYVTTRDIDNSQQLDRYVKSNSFV